MTRPALLICRIHAGLQEKSVPNPRRPNGIWNRGKLSSRRDSAYDGALSYPGRIEAREYEGAEGRVVHAQGRRIDSRRSGWRRMHRRHKTG